MSGDPGIARILVCDDSPSYAKALSLFLEQDRDLRVVGRCATAEEALAQIPTLRPDLVTMDLELPGADGVEAVKWIATRAVPVLVLSAHISRGSERAAAALGAGALDAFPKREISLSEPNSARAIAFRRRVKRLARASASVRKRGPARPPLGLARRGAGVHGGRLRLDRGARRPRNRALGAARRLPPSGAGRPAHGDWLPRRDDRLAGL